MDSQGVKKEIQPIIMPEYDKPLNKANRKPWFRKWKKGILQRSKVKEKKKKKERVLNQTPSLLPFTELEKDHIVSKDGVMDILQIKAKDLYSLSEEERTLMIYSRSAMFRSYFPSIKEVSLNFPSNTSIQRRYWTKKKEKTTDPLLLRYIERKIYELGYLEKERTNREFFLFIYADNEQQLSERKRQIMKSAYNCFPLMLVSNDKKLDILYLLNNHNTKL